MSGIAGVQVLVRWRGDVAAVIALSPPRAFVLGSTPDADFVLPLAMLGRARHPLVSVEASGAVRFFLPSGDGIRAVTAAAGTVERAHFGEIEIELEALAFERAAPVRARTPWLALAAFAFTTLLHAVSLAASAYRVPEMDLCEDDAFSFRPHVFTLPIYADEAQAVDTDYAELPTEGGTGTETADVMGAMGAAEGAEDGALLLPWTEHQSRRKELRAARSSDEPFAIGLAHAEADYDRAHQERRRRWSSDLPFQLAADGKLWGSVDGLDAPGQGAFGLSGVGLGGGGKGEGIGLGTIGTIGKGVGLGSGRGFGDGALDRLLPPHEAEGPVARLASSDVDADAQRVVRRHLAGARLCYQAALRKNPGIEGRVSLRFEVGRDGAVASVVVTASEVQDVAMTSCVARSLAGLEFSATGEPRTLRFAVAFDAGR